MLNYILNNILNIFLKTTPVPGGSIHYKHSSTRRSNMKKKQLFALLGAVIIAISSAACGNSGNSSDTGTAESQEDAGAGNTSGAVDAEAAAQAIADAAGGDTASQDSTSSGSGPTAASEAGNTTLSFSTVDLDGQPVTSEDLFSNNKITMVNIWGTFCGPCINEMPELEKLYAEFTGQGCGIIGIVGDAAGVDDESIISDAKSIIADTGVTYPNILPWDGLQDQLSFNAFPTTYFVDSKGTVIGAPVVGAYIDQYSSRLREALESIEQ